MVLMGDRIESLTWETWLLLLVGGLMLWFLILRFLSRRQGHHSERIRGGSHG